MLLDFLATHRSRLIAMTREKVARRLAPTPTEEELSSGVPLFLDHLADSLLHPPASGNASIGPGAAAHGANLLERGYTVSQVVHDYGDICQAITELAEETGSSMTTDEFHTLNRCLDDAIAVAVTEYTRLRDQGVREGETERSGAFAHELRNRITAAQLAFVAIRSGRAPIGGSVAAVVVRNLNAMTNLINRALVEVRLDAGNTRRQRIALHALIADVEVESSIAAGIHGVTLTVAPTAHDLEVDADPQILAGAIANLLQNAFKFTHAGGKVSLSTKVVGARVEIAVEDECGGLPPGKSEELFRAFHQSGKDRSGLGLGLFISRKGVEASGGLLHVRDKPGVGCVFTIDLPLSGATAEDRRRATGA